MFDQSKLVAGSRVLVRDDEADPRTPEAFREGQVADVDRSHLRFAVIFKDGKKPEQTVYPLKSSSNIWILPSGPQTAA